MNDNELAQNPYFGQVRALCEHCGSPVKVYAIWRLVEDQEQAVIYLMPHVPMKHSALKEDSFECVGSDTRAAKYVMIPCPECRKASKSRAVPLSACLAFEHMICAKHERMRQRAEQQKNKKKKEKKKKK